MVLLCNSETFARLLISILRIFCIITNCSFKFVATEALMLKNFSKKKICFPKASFFFILLTCQVQVLTVAAEFKADFKDFLSIKCR